MAFFALARGEGARLWRAGAVAVRPHQHAKQIPPLSFWERGQGGEAIYDFIPVRVIPSMNRRCAAKNTATTGSMVTSEAAIR